MNSDVRTLSLYIKFTTIVYDFLPELILHICQKIYSLT